jgi:hypothetical protein
MKRNVSNANEVALGKYLLPLHKIPRMPVTQSRVLTKPDAIIILDGIFIL